MSGIVGIYSFNNKIVVRDSVAKMMEALAYRGPDGSSVLCQDNIGLGHLMLWTTPESLQEKLPLIETAGNFIITADARIDNREELIDLLKIEIGEIETIADSEIILKAYAEWGKECPDRLLGDFAFAIWDSEKQHLFCARDHFGVKPFYYYHQLDLGFIFASEIKALFVHPFIQRKVNLLKIADFLELDFSDNTITSYEKMLRLPPAHHCTVSQTGIEIERYWSLNPNREIKFDSDKEYSEAFKEIFTEAVRCRLRSAFPVGSHLSGGLDSSSVTCVARKILAQDEHLLLHTFSNIFDDVSECDERIYINEVLKQGGLEPHYVHADRTKPLSTLEQFWQHEDEAYAFPSYHYLWFLNKATQKAGVRIVLDGFDGDSVVCYGYERLTELVLQGRWNDFTTETKLLAKNYGASSSSIAKEYALKYLANLVTNGNWFTLARGIQKLHVNFGFSRKKILIDHILNPLLGKLKYRLLNGSLKTKKIEFSLLNANFISQSDIRKRFEKLSEKSETVTKSLTKQQHYHNVSNEDGVTSIAFEQADKCSSPYLVEMRHPFFDKRLVEFCLALPSEQKFSQGFDRVIMRKALAGILPPEIQWRARKTSMTPNFLNSIANLDREKLDRIVEDLSQVKKYINTNRVLEAYREVISNQKSNDSDNIILWRSITIDMWLNHNRLWL